MKKIVALLLCAVLALGMFGCGSDTTVYYADIDIADYGTITVKLDQESAPATAANFVNLAQNGFYNGLTFHRIMEGFMMQGGCPNGTDGGSADNYTKIEGVTLADPVVGQQAVAAEEIVDTPEGEETIPTAETQPIAMVTNSTRLATVLTILQSLERNGVVGEVASIDVTDLDHIWLYYGTRYDVNLGNSENMDYKIAAMTAAISELAEYETGELDVSFNIWEDKVGYTPFA